MEELLGHLFILQLVIKLLVEIVIHLVVGQQILYQHLQVGRVVHKVQQLKLHIMQYGVMLLVQGQKKKR